MAKLRMIVELEYDADIMYSDKESYDWFIKEVLGASPNSNDALFLHSNLIGDELGTVEIISILENVIEDL